MTPQLATFVTLSDVIAFIRNTDLECLKFAGFRDFWAGMPNVAMTSAGWLTVIDEIIALSDRLVVYVDGQEPDEDDPNYWVWVDCSHDARDFRKEARKWRTMMEPFAAIGASAR